MKECLVANYRRFGWTYWALRNQYTFKTPTILLTLHFLSQGWKLLINCGKWIGLEFETRGFKFNYVGGKRFLFTAVTDALQQYKGETEERRTTRRYTGGITILSDGRSQPCIPTNIVRPLLRNYYAQYSPTGRLLHSVDFKITANSHVRMNVSSRFLNLCCGHSSVVAENFNTCASRWLCLYTHRNATFWGATLSTESLMMAHMTRRNM